MAKQILVVDDDEQVQSVLEAFLEGRGHEVKLASNGEECLEALKTMHPDLILLDITMPKMNGLNTLKAIKTSEGIKDIPVIIVSALGKGPIIDRTFDYSAVEFIVKPFDLSELDELVQKHTGSEAETLAE